MTGWRCGYAAGPAELIRGMNLVQGTSVSHYELGDAGGRHRGARLARWTSCPPFLAAYRRRREMSWWPR
jgi:aspartate/methionine/tyrosine aminotransferase